LRSPPHRIGRSDRPQSRSAGPWAEREAVTIGALLVLPEAVMMSSKRALLPVTDRSTEPRATATRPLLISSDDDVLDAVLRVAAAVGVDVEVANDGATARPSWSGAPLVIVGHDRLTGVVASTMPRRCDVVVLGVAPEDVALWRRAVDLGAEHVLFLPDADGWLANRLAEATEGRPVAHVVGVVGGCGGAGASTVAAALAVAAARSGHQAMLLDADPVGGGVDLLLGAEATAGSRWADLAQARGRVSAATLADVLPAVAGLSVLAWSRDAEVAMSGEAVEAVLDGARRGSDLVVVDLPRTLDGEAPLLLGQLTTLLLVVPARVRAIAAARQLLQRIENLGVGVIDVRVVVRGPAPGGLDDDDLGRALERPVVGWLDHDSVRAIEEESGEPPGLDERSATGRLARRLLDELAVPATAA